VVEPAELNAFAQELHRMDGFEEFPGACDGRWDTGYSVEELFVEQDDGLDVFTSAVEEFHRVIEGK
jgi:hypothetical protein